MHSTANSTDVSPVPGTTQVDTKGSLGVHTEKGGASATIFGGSDRGLQWLTAVMAGGALVLALMAYREASIATMRVEGMTRALIAKGITNTYPHLDGEDD